MTGEPEGASLFRDALASVRSALPPVPELGEPQLTRVAKTLEREGATATPPLDLDALAGRCVDAYGRDAAEELARRDRRDAAWCLWSTQPAIAGSRAARPYLASLETAERPELKRLASVYVREFSPTRPLLKEIGALLGRRVDVLKDPWLGLSRRLRIFEPDVAPKTLAIAAIDARQSPYHVLSDAGLNKTLARGGLSEAAFLEGLRSLRERRSPDPTDHLALMQGWAVGPNGRWIYRQHRAEIADAVAVPLRNAAGESERELILGFLLSELKDPRLFPANWIGADEAKSIATRWLTQRSLVEFLDVVDLQVRDDPKLRTQWAYRRAFWEGLFHSTGSPIQSAWVVFNAKAAAHARRVASEHRSFATFSGGSSGGRSVLLLDLGRCVVAEWSGDGRCHVWVKERDEGCPELFESSYPASALVRLVGRNEADANATGSFGHLSSESYHWQRRVAEYLMRHVRDLRIGEEQYRLRGTQR